MTQGELEETRDFWDRVASDWKIQVGDEGDENRRLNSDPVLWNFAGDVRGFAVLDAGCGTGYLSGKLRERGAHVTGVDFSEKMIAIARAQYPDMEFHVDSCEQLVTLANDRFDLVVANYVLMDVPDLGAAVRAFHRVLKVDGVAVLVLSHPCFPQGRATASGDGEGVRYDWDFSYFESQKFVDPPWGHFTSDFIWFHRPLSEYWKVFKAAGFQVVDFEEPRLGADRSHLAPNEKRQRHNQTRPISVAFKLQKKV
ncbi:MAG: class I SAM-dependent methyltransferase [Planctomycetota bacterium]